jgi:hypothetical protein
MEPSTWLLCAFIVLVFGFGPFCWIVLTLFPVSTIAGLLSGQFIMNDKRLERDDDMYQADRLAKSEQRKWESINAETSHTEGH